ncbi:MAG: hydrogenase formation protein HypD [Desulfosarcinaceae bacterium]
MTLSYTQAYRDPQLAQSLVRRIEACSTRTIRLMEVCGTHTMAIFRHGIRSLLPGTITLLSGPGCPVCVTAQGDIDMFVELARRPDVVITTFGDLMRVPGSGSSLKEESAAGADVRVVYSPLDAVTLAKEQPGKTVVFLGVGFETTVPTIAAAVVTARKLGLANFCVCTAHKVVPPALAALMANPQVQVDGFLLPGHVSVIIGLQAYEPFFQAHHTPAVVAGFEPTDILQAVLSLAQQIESGRPALENAYPRAVSDRGNTKAQQMIETVFEPGDAVWRGIGVIPGSGLNMRAEFADFDAARRFGLQPGEAPEPKGCACGEILTGIKTPRECPLFRKRCTPMNPVGPCMVSSEGTCAAYYRYSE